MSNRFISLLVLIFLLAGCSSRDNAVDPENPGLAGTWEEEYIVEYLGIGIPEDPQSSIYEKPVISRISFEHGRFIIITYDKENGLSETGFTCRGRFSVAADTVFLHWSNPGEPTTIHIDRFVFAVMGNELSLCEIPVDMGDGLMSISLVSLPWRYGNSFSCINTKNCGTFSRLK